tara:strand:- start:895 stop:1716 length:822 start_codon:yes stop_codon:yes gene_type:complete
VSNHKIIFLIVLYKQKCDESDTVKSIIPQIGESLLYIWDNSPKKCDENDFFLKKNVNNYEYIVCTENHSLSRVYQNVIENSIINHFSHLVILDQDSVLGPDFVSNLEQSIDRNVKSVIIPKILVGSLLVSPSHSWKWFGWHIKNIGIMKQNLVSAINSGVCIPLALFSIDKFIYPCELKNYGTDVYLFEYIRNNKIEVVVSDSVVEHDLTFHKTNTNNESYLKSYIEHMNAMKTIFSKNFFTTILFEIYLVYHGLKLSLVRKDIRFLFWRFND